ncbi:hypothetical protein [Novipirellula galeiformis]|nr:hypothetical protein [Novipirellula galeiformis]
MIRRFARNYRDADISYDRDGIEWLGVYVDSLREKATDLENEQRIFALGCFYGVCLEETIGGEWNFVDDNWRFVSGDSYGIDPFECVRSQLRTDRPVSVLAAFDALEKSTSMSDEP